MAQVWKTEERDSRFWPRQRWNEGHFSRDLWLLFLILCFWTAQKRLLRRLGLDLGAKPLRIRLYGVGCPVSLGGYFLLGVSRISCRSFHCLRSFPLSLSARHQSPCWHSLCITEIFPYKKEANSRISTKQPNQQTKQLSFTIFLYWTTERTTCTTVF